MKYPSKQIVETVQNSRKGSSVRFWAYPVAIRRQWLQKKHINICPVLGLARRRIQ